MSTLLVVGVVAASSFLNYVAWALAAVVAWRYTLAVCADERAAFLAVVFVSFGLGFAIHINDLSPHLFPFSLYYLGMLIVFVDSSGVPT